MGLSFRPLAIVVDAASMRRRANLHDCDRVQAAVELPISAGVHANSLIGTTRAWDRCGAGTHGKGCGIAAVVEQASMTD